MIETLFYELQPDEFLSGFLARYKLTSPLSTLYSIQHLTRTRRRTELCWNYWPFYSMPPFLRNAASLDEQTILNHSMAALFRPTTAPPTFRAQIDRWYGGWHSGQPLVKERLPPTPVQYCPECLRDQIARVGFGYYRRIWAAPFASTCRIHNLTLVTPKCRRCKNLVSRASGVFRPWRPNCARCGRRMWGDEQRESTRQHSSLQIWFEDLATADLPHFSEELQNACLDEAASHLQTSEPSSDTYSLLAPIASEFASRHSLRRDSAVFVNTEHGTSAMLGFWSVMLETFRLFSEFKVWLDANAAPMQLSLGSTGERVTQLDVRR